MNSRSYHVHCVLCLVPVHKHVYHRQSLEFKEIFVTTSPLIIGDVEDLQA